MTTYSGKIGEWDETTANIANEISCEYSVGDEFVDIQSRALEIMGGELKPVNTWEEFGEACAMAAEEMGQ